MGRIATLLPLAAHLVALAAAAFAAERAWQVWSAPPPEATPVTARAAAQSGAVAPGGPQAPTRWPALFGELQPPAPPAPPAPEPAAEPQPPAPPAPPLDSLGYTLKGVVRAGGLTWAMISHPTGERVLKTGDALGGGFVVVRIDEAGVWVTPEGGAEEQLLGFPEE